MEFMFILRGNLGVVSVALGVGFSSVPLQAGGRRVILSLVNKSSNHHGKALLDDDLSQRAEAAPGPEGLPVGLLAGSHPSDRSGEPARSDRRQEPRGGGARAPPWRVQEARSAPLSSGIWTSSSIRSIGSIARTGLRPLREPGRGDGGPAPVPREGAGRDRRHVRDARPRLRPEPGPALPGPRPDREADAALRRDDRTS